MTEINKNGPHFLSYYVANDYSPKEDWAEEIDRTDQIKYFSAAYEIHHRTDRGRGTKQYHFEFIEDFSKDDNASYRPKKRARINTWICI